jgi:molybdopterin molybdotransferase
MKTMVTPSEALEIVLQKTTPLETENLPHSQAWGRTLARDIVSPVELPPFDNSAMDGYAVLAADCATASEQSPVTLKVLETIAAGSGAACTVTSGTAARIMTGAPLPAGADAVVMREETEERGDTVHILAAARPGQSIRRRGSDIRRGEVALKRGSRIRAAEWGLLASLEQTEVEVYRAPRVAIITTGDEVVTDSSELGAGQIRDSNSWTLRGLVQECGAIVAAHHRIGDDPEVLRAAFLECAQTCDAIITSGGVSAGDFDPVRDVLPSVGNVHFYKIAMKPGKPVMFATIDPANNARQQRTIPVFGLPGNPVSVMVAFEQFARPALLKMQGRRALHRVELTAQLAAPLNSPEDKVEFVRATLHSVPSETVSPDQSGNTWRASTTGDQGSGRLSSMTAANALIVIPVGTSRLEAGASVTAQMTDWPELEDKTIEVVGHTLGR